MHVIYSNSIIDLCNYYKLPLFAAKYKQSIYESDVQVIFELSGHFMFTGPSFEITFTKYCLSGFKKLPESIEIH